MVTARKLDYRLDKMDDYSVAVKNVCCKEGEDFYRRQNRFISCEEIFHKYVYRDIVKWWYLSPQVHFNEFRKDIQLGDISTFCLWHESDKGDRHTGSELIWWMINSTWTSYFMTSISYHAEHFAIYFYYYMNQPRNTDCTFYSVVRSVWKKRKRRDRWR